MEKETKTVKMTPNTMESTTGNPQKLTYEQLEQVARDLAMQRNQLQAHLQKAEQAIAEFNDLGVLLSIVNSGENFSSDFIVRCTNRIEKMVSVALDNYDRREQEAKKEEK